MDRHLMKLAIVVPAYNEEKTIAKTVSGIRDFADVIVVDDCSKDQTSQQAESAGAQVVRHETNKGYDGALNTGVLAAFERGYTHVITFDADGQHDPSNIPLFVAAFERGDQLVIGIRPHKQRISETLFAGYSMLRYQVLDPLCGMKGYAMAHFGEIGAFDTLGSTGTELMFRYLKKGLQYSQISIRMHERDDGSPRFGSLWRANKRILTSLKAIVRLDLQ